MRVISKEDRKNISKFFQPAARKFFDPYINKDVKDLWQQWHCPKEWRRHLQVFLWRLNRSGQQMS
ncbi:tRNA lysidine(34) synthetase TilS [Desulfobacula sp.]|uniref:tRNA lysidine(34) synthetase TilS n=1 Tax=Desulfobacula sp. TaxID=2593537 RepID=UPI00345C1B7E